MNSYKKLLFAPASLGASLSIMSMHFEKNFLVLESRKSYFFLDFGAVLLLKVLLSYLC